MSWEETKKRQVEQRRKIVMAQDKLWMVKSINRNGI
jgi:hypothetical protein